jgi:hypothetical protein
MTPPLRRFVLVTGARTWWNYAQLAEVPQAKLHPVVCLAFITPLSRRLSPGEGVDVLSALLDADPDGFAGVLTWSCRRCGGELAVDVNADEVHSGVVFNARRHLCDQQPQPTD